MSRKLTWLMLIVLVALVLVVVLTPVFLIMPFKAQTSRTMELSFESLAAPIARVTGWDTPCPPASLEDGYLPSVERIVAVTKETVAY